MATLWGECASYPEVREGVIMACKGAKVSDYGGRSLNISEGSCSFEFDPKDQQRFQEISKWYKKCGATQVQSITQIGGERSVDPN